MDELIKTALWVFTVQTGRAAVWLLSLGRWRGEPLFGDEGRIFGAAGALSFVRDGQRVITETGLLFAGIASLIALALIAMTIASVI